MKVQRRRSKETQGQVRRGESESSANSGGVGEKTV